MKKKWIYGAVAALAVGLTICGGAYANDAPNKEKVSICTGGTGGNYYPAGEDIKKQLSSNKVEFKVVATKGSMDNFAKLASGDCQYAIVQADSIAEWAARGNSDAKVEEINGLYPEAFHFIVNARAVPGVKQSFANVNKDVTVMRDGVDSGTAVSWENLRRSDKAANKDGSRLAAVPTLPQGGVGALGKLRGGNEAQALIFVSGLNSNIMRRVNAQSLDDKGQNMLCLVDMDDGGMFGKATWERVMNTRGKPMYKPAVITSKDVAYTHLMCGKSTISTFTTDAIVVANRDWKEANSEVAELVAEAIELAIPNINKRMNDAKGK